MLCGQVVGNVTSFFNASSCVCSNAVAAVAYTVYQSMEGVVQNVTAVIATVDAREWQGRGYTLMPVAAFILALPKASSPS